MTDIKLKDGDIALLSDGNTTRLSGIDAQFQRAMICIKAKKGAFVYDRTLGSELERVRADKNGSAQKAQLVINEALAGFENAFAQVTHYGEKITVMLTIDGECRTMEV